ncbi:hypothetical protein [Paenibacillus daejeonensis]|uniref:hypothetical protein n=1 Tax=Paenibacillus daejeonensis TaxID=135193 RepID=UPI00037DAA8E|nr:hypothetical protein [Paenibacillus daejeonensis]
MEKLGFEDYLVIIICFMIFAFLHHLTSILFEKKGHVERSFRCTVIAKHDEGVPFGKVVIVNYIIELESDFNVKKEFRAIGKFKYFQYDKLEIGTRGTAFVRDDVIYKFKV